MLPPPRLAKPSLREGKRAALPTRGREKKPLADPIVSDILPPPSGEGSEARTAGPLAKLGGGTRSHMLPALPIWP